jgi:type I restriction enzyme S subunit
LPVHVPPIEVQRAIVDGLGAVNSLRARHRASLEKLDALFASLQHRAFRGELTDARATETFKEMA